MIGSGAGILFLFDLHENPGKTLFAGFLIALGLFFLIFRKRDSEQVIDGTTILAELLRFWH